MLCTLKCEGMDLIKQGKIGSNIACLLLVMKFQIYRRYNTKGKLAVTHDIITSIIHLLVVVLLSIGAFRGVKVI